MLWDKVVWWAKFNKIILKEKDMVGIVDGKKGSISFSSLKAKVFCEFLAQQLCNLCD
jgi:hypothetical protein